MSSSFPLAVVGVNHRTASGALRERLAGEEAETPLVLARLKALGLDDALWLSTCDRSEIWLGRCEPPLIEAAFDFLSERAGSPVEDLEAEAVNLHGAAALRHVFAVAASLESQIVGEPHILGQVKAAHRAAAEARQVGPVLESALQAAYAAAKRARSETALAEGATSIVAAAVQVARDLHGDLDRCSALLLGGGDMGAMIVEGLQGAGLGRLAVTGPQERRMLATARRFGGRALAWDEAAGALADSDLVIAACGMGRCAVDAPMVRAALKKRRRRPIFFIDAAVPADIDPGVARLDEAYVYDLGDLEGVALAGRAGRDAAQKAAWSIVEEAAAAFLHAQAERGAVPLVSALRGRFEHERRRVLADHPELDADAATRLLVNRLLHRPSEALRSAAASGGGGGEGLERAAARLFGLEEE